MKVSETRKGFPRIDRRALRATFALVAAALVVLTVCSRSTDTALCGGTFAITNCRLIDGTGNSPLPIATLVVSDGLILAAGPKNSTPIPSDAEIVDVAGATVLPGFINAHVHNAFSRENLEAWAQEGVTTVRDLCGPESFALRDELCKDPLCARLVAAGPMISVPNGYPLVPWGSSCMLPVNSVEDARAKVAQLLEDGADIIKLAVESGESFQLNIPCLSPEEALAVVNTAHDYGTLASAHVLCTGDLARAIAAGVNDIAHMVVDDPPDSLIDRMLADSIVWVPTLELWDNVGHGLVDAAIGNLRRFVSAGGMVALGTDFDGYDSPFQLGMPVHEMEWMLEAGMSPMQIIVAGTRNSARACNRLQDLGTLEPGKIADLLVVHGDPLDDIHNLTKIRLVIHQGVLIRGS